MVILEKGALVFPSNTPNKVMSIHYFLEISTVAPSPVYSTLSVVLEALCARYLRRDSQVSSPAHVQCWRFQVFLLVPPFVVRVRWNANNPGCSAEIVCESLLDLWHHTLRIFVCADCAIVFLCPMRHHVEVEAAMLIHGQACNDHIT